MKRENSIANYKLAAAGDFGPISNVNFNKNDGISAKHIINFPIGTTEFEGDYLIVTAPGTTNIISRWFILENRWNREGQLEVFLRRDLLVDYYNDYATEPFYCERGSLGLIGGTPEAPGGVDLSIFNAEGIAVSKPLKEKTLIYDRTQTPWILIFVSKDASGDAVQELRPNDPSTQDLYINFPVFGTDTEDYKDGAKYQIFYPDATPLSVSSPGAVVLNVSRTQGAIYDILAIPLQGRFTETTPNGPISMVLNPKDTLSIAASISEGFGSACYDVQLVPFFPDFGEYGFSYGADGLVVNQQFLNKKYCHVNKVFTGTLEKDSVKVAPLIYCSKYEGSQNLPVPVRWSDAPKADYTEFDPDAALDWKIEHITTKCRIAAPNYSSVFEFTVPAIGGYEQLPVYNSDSATDPAITLNIDYTYKPYQSYIKIAPLFKENSLYGESSITDNLPFGYPDNKDIDVRGCIIQGDMSLPQTSDAWREYTIQNKNFNNSFNREIASLEKQHELQMIGNVVGGGVGVASGAMSGAYMGSMIAPGVGTLIGGIGGALFSGIGMGADLGIQQSAFEENLDYTKDKFNYSLDNIKALPTTISKLSSFDINNSIFPVLEIYKADGTQEQAVRNKIKFDGMTVERIYDKNYGFKLAEDRATTNCPYIRGKLIRSTTIGEDYHILNEIGLELSKGVYVK